MTKADDELRALLEAVEDEPTLLAFMRALSEDTYPWENTKTDRFLEAAAAYGRDSAERGEVAPNPWRRFADLLDAGTIYE